MEKIKIKAKIKTFNEGTLCGKADAVFAQLKKEVDKLHNEGWEHIEFEKEDSYDYGQMVAFGIRIENDKEFNERKNKIEQKQKREELKLQKEKEQYDKLKQKFEGNFK